MKQFTKQNAKSLAKSLGLLLAKGLNAILFCVGLAAIAYGFWDFFRPLAYIIPGAVLLYVSLPDKEKVTDEHRG